MGSKVSRSLDTASEGSNCAPEVDIITFIVSANKYRKSLLLLLDPKPNRIALYAVEEPPQ